MATAVPPPASGSTAATENPSPGSSSSAGAANGVARAGPESGSQDSTFECNIYIVCLSLMFTWLETRPNRQVCPVCKAGISRDKVIPLYGRGSTGQQDPRERTPPRPQGQRPEPENRGGFQGFGFGDGGFQMSFGIGAFPFGIFATAFNINDGRPPPAAPGTPQHTDEQFLSRLFLFVALVIMFWLLIA
uniref:RING-type E3 ubiquitin transferase n=1 Tax=Monopterus albus TaxID=43700 RepID=A0A3Q3ITP6_MONAL